MASTTITIDYLLDSMQDNKIVLLTENLNPGGTILFLASIIQPASGPAAMGQVRRQKAIHQKIHYHNGHSYIATFFNQPTFCAVDHEFIWGIFGTQGYRCQVQ